MILLFLFIGFLVGFFISSIFFQFIIEDVIHEFTMGEVYEDKEQNKK